MRRVQTVFSSGWPHDDPLAGKLRRTGSRQARHPRQPAARRLSTSTTTLRRLPSAASGGGKDPASRPSSCASSGWVEEGKGGPSTPPVSTDPRPTVGVPIDAARQLVELHGYKDRGHEVERRVSRKRGPWSTGDRPASSCKASRATDRGPVRHRIASTGAIGRPCWKALVGHGQGSRRRLLESLLRRAGEETPAQRRRSGRATRRGPSRQTGDVSTSTHPYGRLPQSTAIGTINACCGCRLEILTHCAG